MRILPEPIEFEWDKWNKDKNEIKHNVTFKEAEQVFENEPNFILEDIKHSLRETRFMILGISNTGRVLSVIFTIRKNKVRVISARDMNNKERLAYEENI